MESHALQPEPQRIITKNIIMESRALQRPINKYKITPTFAQCCKSFAFHLPTGLESTFHSPVAMYKIQNTHAIAALSNDTIEAGTQLFNIETQ